MSYRRHSRSRWRHNKHKVTLSLCSVSPVRGSQLLTNSERITHLRLHPTYPWACGRCALAARRCRVYGFIAWPYPRPYPVLSTPYGPAFFLPTLYLSIAENNKFHTSTALFVSHILSDPLLYFDLGLRAGCFHPSGLFVCGSPCSIVTCPLCPGTNLPLVSRTTDEKYPARARRPSGSCKAPGIHRKSRETRVRLEWLGRVKWRQRRPSNRVAPVSGWKSSSPGTLSTQRVEVLLSAVSGTQKLMEPSGRSYMPSTCGRIVACSSEGVCTRMVGTHAYQSVA